MVWEKEIRFRLTLRRIFGLILAAASAANLVIVGLAFNFAASPPEASATTTPTVTHLPATFPPSPPLAGETATLTRVPAATPTPTAGLSPTYTALPTDDASFTPLPTICVRNTWWPVYLIQAGDTLNAIARATGATVAELMRANCLAGTRIDAGRELVVPHLPVSPTPIPASPNLYMTLPAYPF